MDAEDFENLLYVIHSLKSKALAIGAVELSQQAATMEEHLRRGIPSMPKRPCPCSCSPGNGSLLV